MNRVARRLAGLALLAFMAGCRRSAAPDPPPDPKVEGERIVFPSRAPQLASLTVERVTGASAGSLALPGRLLWNDDATVRVFTPFAGRVRRVLADVGQTVRAGAPLAEVDSPDFAQAQADARSAESGLRLADSNLARLRDLFDHGAAARKDVEAAEADEARAASQRAQAAARLASCGADADTVSGRFLLRSPIAGTIVERTLNPGQEIRPDQMLANAAPLFAPLFVVSDPSRLWIQVDAPEGELASLQPGTTFRFSCAAFPDRWFTGRMDLVSEAIDPTTHTLHARGSVANPGRLLKAEMFVSVVVMGAAARGTSVPARAVVLVGERHFVFVEEAPGAFRRREVRVGSERDADVLVTAGVRPGERVVTDGSVLLEHLLD